MRTVRTKVYSFDELSKEAQQIVLNDFRDINVDRNWWEYVYEDAKQAGLTIESFDLEYQGYITGSLMELEDSLNSILNNHGKETKTYLLAEGYKNCLDAINEQHDEDLDGNKEDEVYDLKETYKEELLLLYKKMLRLEYEHLTSDEVIIDTILSNNYEFLSTGKQFN